jgi:hypothetical protein
MYTILLIALVGLLQCVLHFQYIREILFQLEYVRTFDVLSWWDDHRKVSPRIATQVAILYSDRIQDAFRILFRECTSDIDLFMFEFVRTSLQMKVDLFRITGRHITNDMIRRQLKHILTQSTLDSPLDCCKCRECMSMIRYKRLFFKE